MNPFLVEPSKSFELIEQLNRRLQNAAA